MSGEARMRVTTYLADTSYLLCFGGIPRGMRLLRELFDGGLAAPAAVKAELLRLPRDNKKPIGVRKAAEAFSGRNMIILMDAPLFEGDMSERDLALNCIPCVTDPGPHPGVLPDPGEKITEVTTGDNAGEAEAIAAAFRRSVPLLITDGPATRHAASRQLRTEDAAHSLRRISASPKEKYNLYLEMVRAVNNAGAPVKGHLWYRENAAR